jgi:glycosyltransferase involved in cell wall biosynthesis
VGPDPEDREVTRDSLNVLQLYHDCGPGGAEQMILDLCRWLRGQGHRVAAVTCREGWLAERLRADRFVAHVVPQRRLVDVTAIAEVMRIARATHADVLHAHEFPMFVGLAPLARMRGVPMVATIHGREVPAAHSRRRWAIRLAARLSRRVVAVSRSMERFLVDDVGLRASRVETIYNGIEVDRYRDGGASEGLRRDLGLPANGPIVGSMYPVKGQTYLVQAMARVAARVPGAVCLIAGRGELGPALAREAAGLGLGDRVRLLGYRTDVPALLGLMDVFVLPSLSEGLPLSLLEAQAAGKPVVASRVGGCPEALDDGRSGYLVPPRDPQVLAERLLSLLGDPAAARAMGAHGRARVRAMFSLDAMATRYVDIFKSCLKGETRAVAWAG